jgi:hypothetical protein
MEIAALAYPAAYASMYRSKGLHGDFTAPDAVRRLIGRGPFCFRTIVRAVDRSVWFDVRVEYGTTPERADYYSYTGVSDITGCGDGVLSLARYRVRPPSAAAARLVDGRPSGRVGVAGGPQGNLDPGLEMGRDPSRFYRTTRSKSSVPPSDAYGTTPIGANSNSSTAVSDSSGCGDGVLSLGRSRVQAPSAVPACLVDRSRSGAVGVAGGPHSVEIQGNLDPGSEMGRDPSKVYKTIRSKPSVPPPDAGAQQGSAMRSGRSGLRELQGNSNSADNCICSRTWDAVPLGPWCEDSEGIHFRPDRCPEP